MFLLKPLTMIPNLKPGSLSRFEIFPERKLFCNKTTPLYTTQDADLFFTFKEKFNIHTCKRNPLQIPENEQYDDSPPNVSLVN